MERRVQKTPFDVVIGDLVEAKVDAIVNAANGSLQMGGGVAGAIRRQDRDGRIAAECDAIVAKRGVLEEGEATVTAGWKGGPKWVIHAVGPVYRAADHEGCVKRLYNAYWSALTLAVEVGAKTVAFPFLSAGIFGFTADKGSADVAARAVGDFCAAHPGKLERILFVSRSQDTAIRDAFSKALT